MIKTLTNLFKQDKEKFVVPKGVQNAIRNNKDILSTSVIFETRESRIKIGDTDDGREIREEIEDLKQLLEAYQVGLIKEGHRQDSFTE